MKTLTFLFKGGHTTVFDVPDELDVRDLVRHIEQRDEVSSVWAQPAKDGFEVGGLGPARLFRFVRWPEVLAVTEER